MTMSKKDYEQIADAIHNAREAVSSAFEDGTVPQAAALAAVDTVAQKVGVRLQALHRGGYPFKMSRWEDATGMNDQPPAAASTVRVLNDNEPDRL